MTQTWTTQQILTLAPDPASAKAGQGLIGVGKWPKLECSENALWGECQGSGKDPYLVQIDLTEPAFKCSCPSRKFPCKHGIALLLIYANNREAVKESAPPGWVSDWLSKRSEKAEKKAESDKPESEKSPEALAKASDDQSKRAAQREKRVSQGLSDLDLWLQDLIRHGLASTQSKPYKFWEEPAARLVDAQAPGVARMLREMASVPASGAGWQERLMERIGRLTLLMEGYSRIDSLSESLQADIREAIGWNVKQEVVLQGEGVSDSWLVLGQRVIQEDQFQVHRTWTRGLRSGRDALLLNFVRPGQPLEMLLTPGTQLEAEFAFFPGSSPLRALIKERLSPVSPLSAFPCFPNIVSLLASCSDSLSKNLWLETFPASIDSVVLIQQGDLWFAQDKEGFQLPIHPGSASNWHLLAMSGGEPTSVFCEWDGATLFPISLWQGGCLQILNRVSQ